MAALLVMLIVVAVAMVAATTTATRKTGDSFEALDRIQAQKRALGPWPAQAAKTARRATRDAAGHEYRLHRVHAQRWRSTPARRGGRR